MFHNLKKGVVEKCVKTGPECKYISGYYLSNNELFLVNFLFWINDNIKFLKKSVEWIPSLLFKKSSVF